jgi:hypothetical protein
LEGQDKAGKKISPIAHPHHHLPGLHNNPSWTNSDVRPRNGRGEAGKKISPIAQPLHHLPGLHDNLFRPFEQNQQVLFPVRAVSTTTTTTT